MQQLYTDTAEPGPTDGVAGVVAALLQSPQFLYRPEPATGGHGDHRPAGTVRAGDAAVVPADRRRPRTTRCSPPPAAGGLDTEDGLLAETDRLLAGPRAAELFVHVATQWWELDGVATLDKDRSLYRTWTDATPGALAEETRLFLADAWQGTPNLTTLLTAPVTFVDADLAAFYGLPAPARRRLPARRPRSRRARPAC